MGKLADWFVNNVGISISIETSQECEERILAGFEKAGGVSTVGNRGKLSVPDLEKIRKLINSHKGNPSPR